MRDRDRIPALILGMENREGRLDRRADEAGVDRITTLDDVVPLLDRLLAWYESLAAQSMTDAGMRVRMIEGSATPEEVIAFQTEVNERSARHERNRRDMAKDIFEHRHEPIVVMGLWTQHWVIMEPARELGRGDGEFHPESLVYMAGGLKGIDLPADYREQIYTFYGDTRRFMAYGMTEIDPSAPICEAGRYHRPPWVMWLILDQEGERLAEVDDTGVVDGRFAVLSLNHEGRRGGLITGDLCTWTPAGAPAVVPVRPSSTT